ncbi:DNA topoisomerase 3 [Fusobacterium necrophorum]|nr:DNA topoisomerase [Fusobacterium necrophorum]MBR8733440.1 DNA topoisomerase 3 [Fusobacterium necrophorum]MBR8789617.1 DNA topoisomerase 3 [Fusobacterium necrophorum]MCF0163442.1 type IA DNA topoisomerase [Fusobacterium necrophorum]
MKLIIAEKQELAEAIAEALPGKPEKKASHILCGEYIVAWASGHLLTHKTPEEMKESLKIWKMEDLPIYFPVWEKKVIPGKKQEYLFNTIKNFLSKATEIIHAGDADDEGQYLIDEILEFLHNKKPVKRLLVNDNSLGGVKKALANIQDNQKYLPLGKAAEARSISDMIVGFSLSRYFTLLYKSKKPLTIGRVQTPTLALVVNRDLEIENHVKEKYYDLYITLSLNHKDILLKRKNKEMLKSKLEVEEIIQKSKNQKIQVQIKKKKGSTAPPFPFDLTKLQAEANRKFQYSLEKTLEITQNLRDKHKAITYNRSDCQYLSEEHFQEAPALFSLLCKKLGYIESELSPSFQKEGRSKCFNEKEIQAHHGIIPTKTGDLSEFTKEERNIYELIAKRYLIQFLPKEIFVKTEALTGIEGEIFQASHKKILDLGYKNFLQEEEEKKEENKNLNLLSFSEGVYPFVTSQEMFFLEEKETQPKKPYTEATLVEDMKSIAKYVQDKKLQEILKKKDGKGGIGTPATTATIVSNLFKRGYLEKKGEHVVSTKLAQEYLAILPKELKEADMTAIWGITQEKIKDGKAEKEALTKLVLEDVQRIISTFQKEKHSFSVENSSSENGLICPLCGNPLLLSLKKTNYYCKKYKEGCEFKLSLTQKAFQKTITLKEKDVKILLFNKKILVKGIPSSKGGTYDAYFTLEIKQGWGNLKFDSFPPKKK